MDRVQQGYDRVVAGDRMWYEVYMADVASLMTTGNSMPRAEALHEAKLAIIQIQRQGKIHAITTDVPRSFDDVQKLVLDLEAAAPHAAFPKLVAILSEVIRKIKKLAAFTLPNGLGRIWGDLFECSIVDAVHARRDLDGMASKAFIPPRDEFPPELLELEYHMVQHLRDIIVPQWVSTSFQGLVFMTHDRADWTCGQLGYAIAAHVWTGRDDQWQRLMDTPPEIRQRIGDSQAALTHWLEWMLSLDVLRLPQRDTKHRWLGVIEVIHHGIHRGHPPRDPARSSTTGSIEVIHHGIHRGDPPTERPGVGFQY